MSITSDIPAGNPVKITITFADSSGAPFDPDHGIAMDVEFPEWQSASYVYPGQLTREDVGVYSIVVAATEPGSIEAQGRGVLANGLPVTSTKNYQRITDN